MRVLFWSLVVSGLLFVSSVSSCLEGPAEDMCRDDPQFCFAYVRGTVTILNHPELGRTPASSLALVFQSLDCKECRVRVDVNVDGTYGVSLGPGRYRIVMRQGRIPGETVDMLASDQPRIIKTGKAGSVLEFDVRVWLPAN